MILKDGGCQQIACDECGDETTTFESDEFEAMIAAIKADGWNVARPDGHWQHTCPDCVKDGSALEQARRKFGLK